MRDTFTIHPEFPSWAPGYETVYTMALPAGQTSQMVDQALTSSRRPGMPRRIRPLRRSSSRWRRGLFWVLEQASFDLLLLGDSLQLFEAASHGPAQASLADCLIGGNVLFLQNAAVNPQVLDGSL